MNRQRPYSLYLFGSLGRAEPNRSSDTDILVLVHSGQEFVRESVTLPSGLTYAENAIDLTYYSESRIREMHAVGHLFAWHLYLEAKIMSGCCDVLQELGKPNDYMSFEEDVFPLTELLESSIEELDKHPGNVAYEAGLVFVCARNIAMSASYYTEKGLTFSPYAPFLREWGHREFPITKQRYDELRLARLSTTRGGEPPAFEQENLKEDIARIRQWASALVKQTRELCL